MGQRSFCSLQRNRDSGSGDGKKKRGEESCEKEIVYAASAPVPERIHERKVSEEKEGILMPGGTLFFFSL